MVCPLSASEAASSTQIRGSTLQTPSDYSTFEVQVSRCTNALRQSGDPGCESADRIRDFLKQVVIESWVKTPLINPLTGDVQSVMTMVSS